MSKLVAPTLFIAGLAVGYYLWGLNGLGEVTHEFGRNPRLQLTPTPESAHALSEADIHRHIVGAWESDSGLSRTFSVDASVVDSYQGDTQKGVEGSWAVFTSPQGEPPPFPVVPGTIYLRISTVEEVLYFRVTALTTQTLELTYLDGGEVQRFERKQ